MRPMNIFNTRDGSMLAPVSTTGDSVKKEFEFFTTKAKERTIAVPVWQNKAVILDLKGIVIWCDGHASIVDMQDKLYKHITDVLSCMEVNNKFVYLKVTADSAMITKSPELSEEIIEFREDLAFGKYGKYMLKDLIDLRDPE